MTGNEGNVTQPPPEIAQCRDVGQPIGNDSDVYTVVSVANSRQCGKKVSSDSYSSGNEIRGFERVAGRLEARDCFFSL